MSSIKKRLPHDQRAPPVTRHQQRALGPRTFRQRIKSRIKSLVPKPIRSRLWTDAEVGGTAQVGHGEIRSSDSILPAYSAPPSYTTEPPATRFWISNRIRRVFVNPLHFTSRANRNISNAVDLEYQTTHHARVGVIPTVTITQPQVTQLENNLTCATARRSSVTWAHVPSPTATPPEPPPYSPSPNTIYPNTQQAPTTPLSSPTASSSLQGVVSPAQPQTAVISGQ